MPLAKINPLMGCWYTCCKYAWAHEHAHALRSRTLRTLRTLRTRGVLCFDQALLALTLISQEERLAIDNVCACECTSCSDA
eukprot:6201119-Pleurochrysis_carterae.AAC.1